MMYFLFAGETPLGGMDDYRGGFDSVEEARRAFAKLGCSWAQIARLVDSDLATPYGLRIVERYDHGQWRCKDDSY